MCPEWAEWKKLNEEKKKKKRRINGTASSCPGEIIALREKQHFLRAA